MLVCFLADILPELSEKTYEDLRSLVYYAPLKTLCPSILAPTMPCNASFPFLLPLLTSSSFGHKEITSVSLSIVTQGTTLCLTHSNSASEWFHSGMNRRLLSTSFARWRFTRSLHLLSMPSIVRPAHRQPHPHPFSRVLFACCHATYSARFI